MEISAHSDILIHWTGQDIEEDSSHFSSRDDAYIQRLKDILRFGLWMRKQRNSELLVVNGQTMPKPQVPRICFTELKLSMSQDHASLYGALGVGVKRYYIFDRLGGPVHYCQFETQNIFFPPYSDVIKDNEELLSFFKHMCSQRPLNYDLYNESEWRIVLTERLLSKMPPDRSALFINPGAALDGDIKQYYSKLPADKRPDYLIPLDPWLAVIIYPNLNVKKRSIEDAEIRSLLKKISHRSTVTGCPERGHYPMEIDLGACKHF